MIIYGSIYNSLPTTLFDTQRTLLGQGVRVGLIPSIASYSFSFIDIRTVKLRRSEIHWRVRFLLMNQFHNDTVLTSSKFIQWSISGFHIRISCSHQQQVIMDLAVIQIQALVKQTQSQYLMAFALKIGRRLIGPAEQMETAEHGECLWIRNSTSIVNIFFSTSI